MPIGMVPDYDTFVRHVWRYEDQVVSGPPWVYGVLFDDDDEIHTVFGVVESLVQTHGTCPRPMVDPSRVEVQTRRATGKETTHELRFADLEALHVFLLMLATQSNVSPIARQVGEFLMWTLGFRWV
jgi:hypothetical protein